MKPYIALIVSGLALAEGIAFGQKPSPTLASKAQLDFEKVDAAPRPIVADTMSCMQSNAAALAAARVEERYILYYRKGYCELFGALVTKDSETFQAAAKDFTEAIVNWPKKLVTAPPAGLRALATISRMEQGRGADAYQETLRDLESVTKDPAAR